MPPSLLCSLTSHAWFPCGQETPKALEEPWIAWPCLFNFYAEYIMRNPGLEEAQAGIKFAKRNINNLRYADGHYPYGRK